MNLFTLTKAQFLHGGYMHLFGNLLFFCFLSIFVELRVGPLLYGLLYLISGYVGLSSHMLLQSSPHITLMGASANIAGIAGAFAFFFWKKNMRVFVSYFLTYNKFVSIPVYFFFPILVLAGDIAGALSSSSSGGGVAHVAHIGGFLFGVLAAFTIHKLDNLPSEFCYFDEFLKFEKAKSFSNDLKMKSMLEILSINPENQLAHRLIWEQLLSPSPWKTLNKDAKTYIHLYLSKYLEYNRKNFSKFTEILNATDPSWNPKLFLSGLTTNELKKFLNKCDESQLNTASLHILNFLFLQHPKLTRDPILFQRKKALTELATRSPLDKTA